MPLDSTLYNSTPQHSKDTALQCTTVTLWHKTEFHSMEHYKMLLHGTVQNSTPQCTTESHSIAHYWIALQSALQNATSQYPKEYFFHCNTECHKASALHDTALKCTIECHSMAQNRIPLCSAQQNPTPLHYRILFYSALQNVTQQYTTECHSIAHNSVTPQCTTEHCFIAHYKMPLHRIPCQMIHHTSPTSPTQAVWAKFVSL